MTACGELSNLASTHPALEQLRKDGATKVKVAVSDIDGVLRGKVLHIDKFVGAASGGFGFCDVVFGWDMGDVTYDNTSVTGWQHGYPDALACVDLGQLETQPLHHVISQLIYACGRQQVSDVWIAGRHKLRGRVLLDMDADAIVANARQWRERIAGIEITSGISA